MKITIKDITLTDMLQADVDHSLIKSMDFQYNTISDLLDAVLDIEGVAFNVCNQYENSKEYFVINTSYGKLKLNRDYFHSVVIE